MNDIFTLMRKNTLPSSSHLLNVLERVSNSMLFESDDLLKVLDANIQNPPKRLMQKIKSFRQATTNMDMLLPQIREINLN